MMARAIITEFPCLKDSEGEGHVSYDNAGNVETRSAIGQEKVTPSHLLGGVVYVTKFELIDHFPNYY